jgi:hypothetical protein
MMLYTILCITILIAVVCSYLVIYKVAMRAIDEMKVASDKLASRTWGEFISTEAPVGSAKVVHMSDELEAELEEKRR